MTLTQHDIDHCRQILARAGVSEHDGEVLPTLSKGRGPWMLIAQRELEGRIQTRFYIKRGYSRSHATFSWFPCREGGSRFDTPQAATRSANGKTPRGWAKRGWTLRIVRVRRRYVAEEEYDL